MIDKLTTATVKILWPSSGIASLVLAQTIDDHQLMLKALAVLSGIITILLSILLGGFVKHLSGHQQDRADMFNAMEKRTERMFAILSTLQTKESCNIIHENMDKITQKLDKMENTIKQATKEKV